MDRNNPETTDSGRSLLQLTRQNAALEQQIKWQAEKIRLLTIQCEELQRENETLRAKPDGQTASATAYQTGWNWYRKITWVLNTEDKPMLSQELIARLKVIDENLRHNTNPVGFISAYLTNATRRRLLHKHKQGGTRGYYYCLPHWMNGDVLELNYLKKLY